MVVAISFGLTPTRSSAGGTSTSPAAAAAAATANCCCCLASAGASASDCTSIAHATAATTTSLCDSNTLVFAASSNHARQTSALLATAKNRNFHAYALYAFNIVSLVAGTISLMVSLIALSDQNEFVTSKLPSLNYVSLSNCLLTISAIIVVLSVLGCAIVFKENRPFLLWYMFLLLFIFVTETFLGVISLLNRDSVSTHLRHAFNESLLKRYPIDKRSMQTIDRVQQQMQCCGLASVDDWRHSNWYKDEVNGSADGGSGGGRTQVPDSCCKTMSPGCGRLVTPNNVPFAGCADRFDSFIGAKLNMISVITLSMCPLPLIGIALSFSYYFRLQKQYRYSKAYLIR